MKKTKPFKSVILILFMFNHISLAVVAVTNMDSDQVSSNVTPSMNMPSASVDMIN